MDNDFIRFVKAAEEFLEMAENYEASPNKAKSRRVRVQMDKLCGLKVKGKQELMARDKK
jgi:hypothetical protein